MSGAGDARNAMAEYEVKFQLKRVPARTVREILELATAHRAELFEEWERSLSDE